MQHVPEEVLFHIYDHTVDDALLYVCCAWWRALRHRRWTMRMALHEDLPRHLQTLPRSLNELTVPFLDNRGAEALTALADTFALLSRLRLIHDVALPGQQLEHLTERGLMGIHHLIRICPQLSNVHLVFIMEANALVVAAWQLLLYALPPTVCALTLVCFVINHRHFVPLAWHLPVQGGMFVPYDTLPLQPARDQVHLLL
jgi:hypothetical protein